MKKIIYLLLLTGLIAACKKKKNNKPSPAQNVLLTQNQNCLISKIQAPENGENREITITHDDKGNLIKVVITGGLIDTYTYSKNSIVCEIKDKNGEVKLKIMYSLDDSGKIISEEYVSFSRKGGSAASVTTASATYKYTNDGYLSVLARKNIIGNDVHIYTYTYTWENGNITSIERTSVYNKTPQVAMTSFFQYGAEAFPVNFVIFEDLNEFPTNWYLTKYFGKMRKNLPSRIRIRMEEEEQIIECAYQKDDKENIVKYTASVLKPSGEEDVSRSEMYYYNCK